MQCPPFRAALTVPRLQSAAFLIFLIILALVLSRLRSRSSPQYEKPLGSPVSAAAARPPLPLLFALAASALLIFLRTIFRLAETAQGIFGSLSINEGYFGGLEFAPVVVALAVWAAVPLGRGLRAMERV